MKKFDLPLLLDVLFYAAAVWFLSVGVLRYFRVTIGVSVAVATLLALAAGGVCFLLTARSHRLRALSRAEREAREKLLLHLALDRPESVRAALLTAFAADGRSARCDRDAISLDGELLLPAFTMQPLSADAVAAFLREYGAEPFCVACNALSPEAERLLSSFGKTAMRGDEVYALFARTGTTPDPLLCGGIPRPKLRARLRRAFSKSNARPFFVCGIALLTMSLFALFPVYYLVSGSVLLAVALCVRMLGYA